MTDSVAPQDVTRAVDRPSRLSPGRWWLMLLLAVAGLGLSAYLTLITWNTGMEPVGCGSGSGCAAVLTSRWAKLAGMPVSLPAMGVYLLALAGLGAVRSPRPARPRVGWGMLATTAAAVVFAAGWFLFLQYARLDAWCPYCLATHAVGLAFAGLVGGAMLRPMPRGLTPAGAGAAVILAALGMGLLAGLQLWAAPPVTRLADLPDDRDYDRMLATGRHVGLLGGTLRLDLDEEPVLGSSEAPQILGMMYDYACPHCRATHQLLRQIQAEPAGPRFAVVMLPMPMNQSCNPAAPDLGERFAESCELTRISLAVWRAEPEAFPAFTAWMYEPERPRTADQARAEADRRVGAEALAAALADPWIDRVIERNAAAWAAAEAQYVPVTLSPFAEPRVGRIKQARVIHQLLEESGAGAALRAERAGADGAE